MCGIGGIFAYRNAAPAVDEEQLLRIREAMRSRGPDGTGAWFSPSRRVGLCHRRLAIIDLSDTGAQPMVSPNGRLAVTFNGEIYNYREIRRELEGKGYVFRSSSDTEVLLHLYADRGADMVHSLRGMYAFAIWDSAVGQLFMARDPFGIKPLYFADDGSTVRFASQVKALLCGGDVDRSPDAAGTIGFLIWGSVPEPFTLYRGIRSLSAGSTITVRTSGEVIERRFFDVAEDLLTAQQERRSDVREMTEVAVEALRSSIRHHLVSDVPVALFLSSGLDSTMIAVLAAREARIHSLTLGFDEYRGTPGDETIHAERLAAKLGINHATRWIKRDDFLAEIPGILEAMDQPSIDGVNTYLVSKAAASAGIKVALSGLGGDELFGSYSTFREIPRLVAVLRRARVSSAFGRRVRRALEGVFGRLSLSKYAGLLEYGGNYPGAYLLRRALFMPWELEELLDSRTVAEGLDRLDILGRLEQSVRGISARRPRVASLEMQWYLRNQLLRDADWAGMAHSVEIRTPLVDATLFRTLAPFLASETSFDKRSIAKALGAEMPTEILQRKKTGFSVPVRDWLGRAEERKPGRHGLRAWALTVHRIPPRKRVLALMTDAFGGYGGIALYNRDLLHALCKVSECAEVVALPRIMAREPEPMPANLRYETAALGGKIHYFSALMRELVLGRPTHLVLCCHVHLLPLAWLAKRLTGAPLVLVTYGIEAWRPPSGLAARLAVKHVDHVVSISKVTAQRFAAWSGRELASIAILPNAIHLNWYGLGPRNESLVARYGLRGKRVVATVGRLASSERYKGFDEVLELLPDLLSKVPNLVYLIIGDGSDRTRLEAKAEHLGVRRNVVFTGFVSESEKADHYRLADVYAMPSRGEGFGFVLLEAMACGIPVVASNADGTREAVRDGLLGALADPGNRTDVESAILRALDQPDKGVPAGLEHFSFENFTTRTSALFARFARD